MKLVPGKLYMLGRPPVNAPTDEGFFKTESKAGRTPFDYTYESYPKGSVFLVLEKIPRPPPDERVFEVSFLAPDSKVVYCDEGSPLGNRLIQVGQK